MKKSKAHLIKQVLADHDVPFTKAGYRRAKRTYNTLSKQGKAKVG